MNNLQKKKSRNNNDNSLSSTSKATLIINDHSIECKITPSNKGERVLGIYINAHNKTQQTISKAKMIVKSQLNILSALFNTAVLRPIVLQKLDVLSSEIWYPTIPNCLYKYADISTHASYLTKSLALISLYNFNINLTSQRTILGGNTPIRDYLPNLSNTELKSLRIKKIMYMDQLVSADGRYLLTWNEIKINNNTKYKGKIPRWFKDIEDNYTLSNYRTLTTPTCQYTSTTTSKP
ncbi:unnamed protein product [Rhizophagus irregularis]|nr:unnamed protein product [Rhizophagus irregularis]